MIKNENENENISEYIEKCKQASLDSMKFGLSTIFFLLVGIISLLTPTKLEYSVIDYSVQPDNPKIIMGILFTLKGIGNIIYSCYISYKDK